MFKFYVVSWILFFVMTLIFEDDSGTIFDKVVVSMILATLMSVVVYLCGGI